MLFDAEPEYIATLDSKQLVQLMRRLLLAESRLTGVPLRGATVPLQVTVPDGGEDGRVEWSGGEESTPYFPSRLTIFQSKAQDLTDARVKAEVLKRPKNKPAKLSPAISEVLAKSGAYIVFCRQEMVGPKKKSLQKAIKDAIKAGGGKVTGITVEIYDANLIADWTNRHPAVALWLASARASRNLAGFQTHDGWGRSPDVAAPWKPSDEPRFAPVNRVVPEADRKDKSRSAWTFEQAKSNVLNFLAEPKSIVRISGPSGFGKSRVAYEILAAGETLSDQIDSSCVVYCDGSLSGEDVAKLALEAADAELPAILVVDECSDQLHQKLANLVTRSRSQLRLVTIDIETKVLQAAGTLSLRIEKADDKLIGDIAKGVSPTLTDTAASFITTLSEGFPRMAVLAAQQDGEGRQTLESVEQVLERIIWSGKAHNAEAQRALEVASLFDWFGIQGRVESQAAVLAELAGQSPSRFVEHLLSFKARGIITQRGDFIQIGPVPLAARLGLARLALMTADQLSDFFAKAPDELKASLLKRFKWVDTSPTAGAFAERLLQPSALGNFAALNTETGARALDRLVHVAPDVAMQTIERVFGSLTPAELKAATGARRHLVWALEKLVFRRKTFPQAARLLRKLAIAETENFSNNATGTFKQLYQLYLSGTEAEPAERIAVLDEGLASTDQAERKLCIDALEQMLDSTHFSRGGGSEQIGSAGAMRDWQPKTYGEIWDFHRAAVGRLVNIATSDDVYAELAQQHLGSHIRGLLNHLPASEVLAMIQRVIAHRGFWPEALSGVSHWLFYDRGKKVPKEIAQEIRAMYDALLPRDLVDLAVLYANGWQMDLYDPDSQYDSKPSAKHDFDYSARKAIETAEKVAKDTGEVKRAIDRLACGDGKGTYPFAKALMLAVIDPTATFKMAVAAVKGASGPPNRGFFGGLIAGADERDRNLARSFVKTAMKVPRLKAEAVALIGSGRLELEEVEMVISLLRSGDVKPWECQNLGLGRADLPILMPLLEELEQHGTDGLWTIVFLVDMYLYGGTKQLTKLLVELVKRVLLNPELLEKTRNNMDGHHLEVLAKRLVDSGHVKKTYAGRLSKQLLSICRKGSDNTFYQLDDPVRKILGELTQLYPQTVWDEIAKKLTSRSWHTRFYIQHLLEAHNHFDEDHLGPGLAFQILAQQFMQWVRAKPSERAAAAIDWLPIAERDTSGALMWHPELLAYVDEFGNRPEVLAGVSSRLHPKSWTGGLAPYLEPVVPLVETWLVHKLPSVREWAAKPLQWLRDTIREEQKRSEEDVVRFD